MHIDTHDLLQGRFAISNVGLAGGRLVLSDQMLIERPNDDVFDVGRRNTGDRPD
jgi:hypothetical protein